MGNSDEILAYLHGQIGPRDQSNPKYAEIWKQIAAVRKAQAAILAARQPEPIYVSVENWPPEEFDQEGYSLVCPDCGDVMCKCFPLSK